MQLAVPFGSGLIRPNPVVLFGYSSTFRPQDGVDFEDFMDPRVIDLKKKSLDDTLGAYLRAAWTSEMAWNKKGNKTAVLLNPWHCMPYKSGAAIGGGPLPYPWVVAMRRFVSSHLHPKAFDRISDDLNTGFIPQALGATAGVHLFVVTSDDFVLLGRRSPKLAVFPGCWGPTASEGIEMTDFGDSRLASRRALTEEVDRSQAFASRRSNHKPAGVSLSIDTDHGNGVDVMTTYYVKVGYDLKDLVRRRAESKDGLRELPGWHAHRLGERLTCDGPTMPSLRASLMNVERSLGASTPTITLANSSLRSA